MKKLIVFLFIFIASILSAQQNEDFYNTARLLIHGEDPVGVIVQVTDDTLYGLRDYAMGFSDVKTIKQLNDDDAWLLTVLCFIEDNRRAAKTTDEFLVYLQGRTEWLRTQPITGRTGRAEAWVDSYEWQIRLHELSVGK